MPAAVIGLSETPLVTVVTPSFNQAEFLPATIESVLSQDYPRIEYIVMDGGSTDGSAPIIDRHANRLAWWQSRPDDGQADAVNQGWERSHGEILAFLNSDDLYLPGAVTAVVAAFTANPDVELVHGQAHWITTAGRVLQTTSFSADSAQGVLSQLVGPPQPATFIRRAVIDRIGTLDASLHFVFDLDFHLRAIGTFRTISLRQPIACMRLHPKAKTVALGANCAPELLRVVQKIVDAPQAYPRFEVQEDLLQSRAHQMASQFLYMHGQFRRATVEMRRAIAIAPSRMGAILGHELPRLALRSLVGWPGYVRLSGHYRTFRRDRAPGP